MEFYDFPFSWNFIIPTDELTPSFFTGVGIQPVEHSWIILVQWDFYNVRPPSYKLV